jgi:hypothetical protein
VGAGSFRFALLLLLSLVSAAYAQDSDAGRPIEDRNKKLFERYEDQVAQVFESIRLEKGLPKLTRILRRRDLDQLVCTTALNDAGEPYELAGGSMYKTSDPVSVTDGLKSSAEFNHPYTPPSSRYAVAIWPGTDKESGKRTYWVGIHVYPSAFAEFIAYTFTDSRPSRNSWKKLVAPACRGVE